MADFDQAGGVETGERFADRRPRHAQHLGEPALVGQQFAGRHFAAEHVGHDLFEDVVRYRLSSHLSKSHAPTMPED